MRKAFFLRSIVVLVLSLMMVGTTLAQDSDPAITPWLGIRMIDTDTGVTVTRVSVGSPAETGGMLVDDVIVSVDDDAVDTSDTLIALIQAHAVGDAITVTVQRDGSEQALSITLASAADHQTGEFNGEMDPAAMAGSVLGVELSAVDEGYQVIAPKMMGPGERGAGSEAPAATPDTSATPSAEQSDTIESLLLEGDIITAVNDTAIAEVDWQILLSDLTGQDEVVLTLTVLRDGEEITVEVTPMGGMFGDGGHNPMGQGGQGQPGGDQGQPGGDQGQMGQGGQPPMEQGGGQAPPNGDSTSPNGTSV